MSTRTQDYKSHRRWFAPFHYIALPILSINMFLGFWHAYRIPTRWNIWTAVVGVALVALTFAARVMAGTVQDRVIRLEMRMRLKALLAAPLAARINELTPRQLVGLRFAGDAEMPGLVERCLSGELKNDEAVKKEIKDWQADWLRA